MVLCTGTNIMECCIADVFDDDDEMTTRATNSARTSVLAPVDSSPCTLPNNMPSWCTQLTVQPARRHLWVSGVEPPGPSEKVSVSFGTAVQVAGDQATCPETKGRRLEDATRDFFFDGDTHCEGCHNSNGSMNALRTSQRWRASKDARQPSGTGAWCRTAREKRRTGGTRPGQWS